MTSADPDWPLIKELMADAMTLHAAERETFLDRRCPDPAQRTRVERLLRAADAAGHEGFLEESAPLFAAALLVGALDDEQAIPAELRTALAGRYAIEREVGRGGMAVVYLATDERHGRQVALKVLRTDRVGEASTSRNAARFEREIGFAARLSHPNILPLYDSGVAADSLFYVTPFAERESLRERLRREGRLPLQDALRVLRDVTRALAHAHAHGLVHRDIKPGNILFTRDGDALVADFGIAKAVAAVTDHANSTDMTLTELGLMVGTPAYVAPEQVSSAPEIDHRADLYALGIVAYEMLAGAPPFAGRRPHEMLAAHLAELPAPLDSRRPDLPEAVVALVHRLLAKRPEERPFDASEVLQAMDAAQVGMAHQSPIPHRPNTPALPGDLGTSDAQAAEHYLKGRFLYNTRQRDGLRLALEHFESAVALDPGFARAHAGLADVHVLLGVIGMVRPHEAFAHARASAARAIAIEPSLVEAHAAIAHALTVFGWEWQVAGEAFTRAITLGPRYPAVRLYYASYLHAIGQPSAALAQLEVARSLDPLVPTGMLSGRVYVDRGQPDAALKVLLEEVRLDPRRDLAQQLLAHAYLQKGMHREAIEAMERAAALSGPRDTAQLAYVHAVTGDPTTARRLLAPLLDDPEHAPMLGFHLAMAHAALGEADAAFAWLEAAYRERGSFMVLLAVATGFDAIRTDPRFDDLLHRMGLSGVMVPASLSRRLRRPDLNA